MTRILCLGLILVCPFGGRAQERVPVPELLPPPAEKAAPPAPPLPAPQIPAVTDGQPQPFLIDLPTALRLTDAQNPQIQFARERIREAEARLERANVLWLPNLSAGTTWTRHDGQIQEVRGDVIPVSRSALFVGGGPQARFDLADAIYAPLAARQVVAAQLAAERVTANDTLLDVSLGYWELIRARAAVAISEEAVSNSRKLDELAQSYLKAGKLRAADAERARTELRGRTQELEAAQETGQVVSIRLAQLLRLDPFVMLEPAERQALPITLVNIQVPTAELAAIALGNRPELAESQALVRLAQERLRQATYGPLLPHIIVDARGGGFGGGRNGFFGDFDGRSDIEAAVVWELQNLGFGDRALRRERASEVRQAQIREIGFIDRVIADVAVALARVKSRRAQMESARQAVESAARSYELNWKLFTDGGIELIRPIEVLQSIQALVRARQDYLNALIEHNRAQFRLHWALGYPTLTSFAAK